MKWVYKTLIAASLVIFDARGASTNLQALIGEQGIQAPVEHTPTRTTSPETLALLDKLMLEETTPGAANPAKTIIMPRPVPPPANFFDADHDARLNDICGQTVGRSVRKFEQALALAICQDPQLRMLSLNLRNYLLDYKMSQASWMPEINFLFNTASESDKYKLDGRDNIKLTDRTMNNGIELNWLLFDFGKREALIGQKKNIWLSTQYQTLANFQDFIINFSKTWYQVIARRTILTAAKENEQLARKTWDITQNRYRSGVGVLGDALQAENVLLSATQYRIQKEGEYQQALGQLSSALNLPVTQRLEPEDAFDIPSSGQMMALKPLLDEAIRQHPMILAAQKNIAAAEQQVNQAQRDFMPTVSLQADINQGTSSLDQNRYTPINRTDTMYVGVNVSVPLFSGFRRYNQLQAANVQLDYAKEDYQKVTKDVELNTWNTWQALNTANRNVEIISQRLSTAHRAYDIANGRYVTGVGTIIELLNTQQQLSSAEMDEATTIMDWYLQRLSLLAAVGKLSLY